MKYLIFSLLILSSSFANAVNMTCSCTSGSMVVTVGANGSTFSCTGGGRISCKIK